jgi:ElaB/YqjD/DUF883 family membrane-anchored ribosome-binding protein
MTDPDQIRADIERTRGNLSADVNALTDSVSPGNVARRQASKARGAAVGVKNKVMGTAGAASSHTSSAASSLSDSITGAPDTMTTHTRGNPVAAGLIALGAGLLVGSLLPASRIETELAAAVKDNAPGLAQPVTEAAKSVAADMQDPMREAVASVKATATDAAATVKEEGAFRAEDVKSDAMNAKDAVQDARS